MVGRDGRVREWELWGPEYFGGGQGGNENVLKLIMKMVEKL